MLHRNIVEKNAAMRALGAEVVEFGADFQEARERSIEFAAQRRLEAVPPLLDTQIVGAVSEQASPPDRRTQSRLPGSSPVRRG